MRKKVIVIFVIMLIGVLLVVLNSTVFVVRTVDVVFPITDKFTQKDILDNCKSMYDMNIFTVSEKKSLTAIEKNNPYAKVINIEKVFPNGIIVHTDVRRPIMTISVANSTDMLLVDDQLKILEIVSSNAENPYTKIGGMAFNNKEYRDKTGEFITKENNIFGELYAIVDTISSINNAIRGEGFYEFVKAIHFIDAESVLITLDSDTFFKIGRATAEHDLIVALSSM